MAEHDNAGFPLTYCLLSTATAIDNQKRLKALVAWTTCLQQKYGIDPIFTHVDKDMAEIGCLREVWNAKISLCWWHLHRAVRTRLAKAKLTTTPYNVKRAYGEFPFIKMDFIPPGTRVDVTDYEGGPPDDNPPPTTDPPISGSIITTTATLGDITNGLRIRIPITTQQTASRATTNDSQLAEKESDVAMDDIPGRARNIIKGTGFTLLLNISPTIASPPKTNETAENQEISEDEDGGKKS